MTVSLDEIREMFGALIGGTTARPKIQKWAAERMEAGERNALSYEPATETERIWEALVFLASVDLNDSTESYLAFRDRHNLRVSALKVSISDLRQAFDDLIAGRRTPDDIDRWACGLMAAHDREELLFEPSSQKECIWKALQSLCGCDMPGADKEPLYGVEDFIAWRDEFGLS